MQNRLFLPLSFLFLLLTLYANGQNSQLGVLQPIDSLKLKNIWGDPILMPGSESQFATYSYLFGQIAIYGINTQLTKVIQLDTTHIHKNNIQFNNPFLGHSIWVSNKNIILITKSDPQRLYFFDYSGKLQKTLLIKMKPHFHVRDIYSSFKEFSGTVSEDNRIIVPLLSVRFSHRKTEKKYFRQMAKYYKRQGILGEIDLNTGKLIRTFAEYDGVYQKGKFYEQANYFTANYIGRDSVFVNFDLSDSTFLYVNGKKSAAWGARGKYFNQVPEQYFAYSTIGDFRLESYKPVIETPFYTDCRILDGNVSKSVSVK